MFREWLSDPSDLKVERPRKLLRLLDGGAAAATLAGPPATDLACAPWPPALLRLWAQTVPDGEAPPQPCPDAGDGTGKRKDRHVRQ